MNPHRKFCFGKEIKNIHHAPPRPLTAKQQEIYDLWQTGLYASQIARELGVTTGTISQQIHFIKKKGWSMEKKKAHPEPYCKCGCGLRLEKRPGELDWNFRRRRYFDIKHSNGSRKKRVE